MVAQRDAARDYFGGAIAHHAKRSDIHETEEPTDDDEEQQPDHEPEEPSKKSRRRRRHAEPEDSDADNLEPKQKKPKKQMANSAVSVHSS